MGGRSGGRKPGRLMPGEGGSGEGRRVHRGDRVVCGGGAAESSRRARRAARIVFVLVLAFLLTYIAAGVFGLTRQGVGAGDLACAVRSAVLPAAFAEDAAGARDEMMGDALADVDAEAFSGSCAPAWFEREICPPADFPVEVANGDWSVVGFSSDRPLEDELDRLCGLLASHGWTGYESGVEGVATFGKDEGVCRWAMVLCTDMGGATSAVLQIQRSSEDG